MIDKKKVADGAQGGAMLGAAVLAKLSYLGLTVADVVCGGAVKLADAFVKAPKIGRGADKLVTKAAGKCDLLAKKLWAKGLEKLK